MTYKPLGDTVLIEVDIIEEEKTSSGIIIAKTQSNEVRQKGKETGTILSVGHLLMTEDTGYKSGDRVVFKRYAGTYLEDENSRLRLVSDADILAVIK